MSIQVSELKRRLRAHLRCAEKSNPHKRRHHLISAKCCADQLRQLGVETEELPRQRQDVLVNGSGWRADDKTMLREQIARIVRGVARATTREARRSMRCDNCATDIALSAIYLQVRTGCGSCRRVCLSCIGAAADEQHRKKAN